MQKGEKGDRSVWLVLLLLLFFSIYWVGTIKKATGSHALTKAQVSLIQEHLKVEATGVIGRDTCHAAREILDKSSTIEKLTGKNIYLGGIMDQCNESQREHDDLMLAGRIGCHQAVINDHGNSELIANGITQEIKKEYYKKGIYKAYILLLKHGPDDIDQRQKISCEVENGIAKVSYVTHSIANY